MYNVMFYLLPTPIGGRSNHIAKEYTPNVVFGFSLEELSAFLVENEYKFNLPDNEFSKNCGVKLRPQNDRTYPGGIALAEMMITKEAERYISKDLLQKGTSFIIREGTRIVGVGEII